MAMQMPCHEDHACTRCGRDSHISTEEITLSLIEQQNIAILARSNVDIRKLQMEDPSISFVLHAKETGEHPNSDVIKGQGFNSSKINAAVAKIDTS